MTTYNELEAKFEEKTELLANELAAEQLKTAQLEGRVAAEEEKNAALVQILTQMPGFQAARDKVERPAF